MPRRRAALALCIALAAAGVVPAVAPAEVGEPTIFTVGPTYFPGDTDHPGPLGEFRIKRGDRLFLTNVDFPFTPHTVTSGTSNTSTDQFVPGTIPENFWHTFTTPDVPGGQTRGTEFCALVTGTTPTCGDRAWIAAGTYPFYCAVHPTLMFGRLVVEP